MGDLCLRNALKFQVRFVKLCAFVCPSGFNSSLLLIVLQAGMIDNNGQLEQTKNSSITLSKGKLSGECLFSVYDFFFVKLS